jgi:hypothetical protein
MTEQEMLLGAVSCLVGCIGYLHKRLSDSFDVSRNIMKLIPKF